MLLLVLRIFWAVSRKKTGRDRAARRMSRTSDKRGFLDLARDRTPRLAGGRVRAPTSNQICPKKSAFTRAFCVLELEQLCRLLVRN